MHDDFILHCGVVKSKVEEYWLLTYFSKEMLQKRFYNILWNINNVYITCWKNITFIIYDVYIIHDTIVKFKVEESWLLI